MNMKNVLKWAATGMAAVLVCGGLGACKQAAASVSLAGEQAMSTIENVAKPDEVFGCTAARTEQHGTQQGVV